MSANWFLFVVILTMAAVAIIVGLRYVARRFGWDNIAFGAGLLLVVACWTAAIALGPPRTC